MQGNLVRNNPGRWLGLAPITVLAFLLFAGSPRLHAEQKLQARADLEQRLGTQIPLDLTFTDETGKTVPLRQYFGQHPVILQLGYNHCWLMCDVVTGALVRSLQDLRLTPGADFTVLFVSIDPNETFQLAARKREGFVRSYGRSEDGWHFLTGRAPEIAALSNAVGFHFFYDSARKEYVHPSGIIVATPQGVVSKYFYGVEFDPSLLHASLVKASGGTIGSRVQALLLLCCEWNPLTGKYGPAISILLKVFCLGTVAVLLAYILVWLRRDAARRREADESQISQ